MSQIESFEYPVSMYHRLKYYPVSMCHRFRDYPVSMCHRLITRFPCATG